MIELEKMFTKGRTLLLILLIVGCAGYSPTRYAAWDAKIRELCQKDAGVTVYERVKLAAGEYRRLGGVGGTITVPLRDRNTASPYVRERQITWLHAGNPDVFREETLILRRADGKVLSRLVTYGRVGQEVIQGYGCSDVGVRLDIERQTFEVMENHK